MSSGVTTWRRNYCPAASALVPTLFGLGSRRVLDPQAEACATSRGWSVISRTSLKHRIDLAKLASYTQPVSGAMPSITCAGARPRNFSSLNWRSWLAMFLISCSRSFSSRLPLRVHGLSGDFHLGAFGLKLEIEFHFRIGAW